MTNTRITGKLPAATLEQRLAGMSEFQLEAVARKLATDPEQASGSLITSVLEALERKVAATTFAAFVAEIYS